MAYDRYYAQRDQERGRHRDHDRSRERGHRDDRGYFERAGDEVASWFGDEDAERRRHRDDRSEAQWGRDPRGERGWGHRDNERDYRSGYGEGSGGSWGGAFTGSDYDRSDYERRDFGRGEWQERSRGRGDFGRDNYGDRDTDRSYHAWRQRQLDELDRDYDEYRREHSERFESDFGSWRQNRQQKRGLLGKIHEHMDVVGSDGETIGKVDKVRGDHVILTKSDSDDNRHHSIRCSMIDKVEDNRVCLDVPAEEAKSRWKDEDERGFFGGGDDGHVTLERSFSGTYR